MRWLPLIAVVASTSCTTVTLKELYDQAPLPRRDEFMALYPDLNAEQRKEFLTKSDTPAIELLHAWNIDRTQVLASPRVAWPIQLVVETDAKLPIKDGRKTQMRAYLEYPDRRKIEVTEHVAWKAQPALVEIDKKGKLTYDCVRGEARVKADFLGERAAELPLPMEKPIRSIEVGLAGGSQVISQDEFLTLQLRAYCTDGTISDVTCQAEWKLPEGLGRLGSCGYLQVYSKQYLNEGAFPVTGSYGGKSQTNNVHFSVRQTR